MSKILCESAFIRWKPRPHTKESKNGIRQKFDVVSGRGILTGGRESRTLVLGFTVIRGNLLAKAGGAS